MPDPTRLLDVARLLAASELPEARRRAISTSYYALFHCLAAYAANRFVGAGNTSPAYAMFYRSLDHTKMRSIFVELGKSTFRVSIRKALGRTTSSAALRSFAELFVDFQERRQLADYDPFMPLPTQEEIEILIDDAARALQSFDALDSAERDEMLALMIAGARA